MLIRHRSKRLALLLLLLATAAGARDADTTLAHFDARRYDDALAAARTWADTAPDDDDAWYMQGLSLIALDRAGEAVGALQRATRIDPEDAYNWSELGRAQSLRDEPQLALDAWRRAFDLDVEAFGARVSNWYTSDFDAVALDAARFWTTVDARSDRAWFLFGASLLFLDRPAEALEPLQKALALRSTGSDSKSLSDVVKLRAFTHAQIGFAHEAIGNHDDAAKSWRACMALVRSECTDAIEEHYLRGRLQPVLAAGRTLRELSPNFDEGWYYEGAALFHLDRERESIAPLRKAAALDDEDYVNHYMLGNALLHTEQPAEALQALERALQLDSTDADVHARLAEAYEELGRTDAAAEARAQAEALAESD
jgi:tetratricopeptide (TPR) repeat protein